MQDSYPDAFSKIVNLGSETFCNKNYNISWILNIMSMMIYLGNDWPLNFGIFFSLSIFFS